MHSREKWYYVHIVTNRFKTLYTGITSKLRQRIRQNKTGEFEGFTSKYQLDRLVYWERFKSVHNAIAREKQIKGWRRIKKIELIVGMNPTWADLAADWYPELNA